MTEGAHIKIYIAGPMRGLPRLNFPAFHNAAAALRAKGHEVFSPAELAEEIQCDIRKCFAADTQWLALHAEAIALLPGWDKSRGARAERALARALDLEVILL